MVVNNFCFKLFGLQQSYEFCKNIYWKMESVFVYLFLPLAGLTIIWKRNEVFAKIWMNVERIYLPVAFYSFGRRNHLVSWARRRLPPKWSSCMETLSDGIADFWHDGSLLCTLINTAVPGACPNPYRHWQKAPNHAQDVAYKYLGIFPAFSESDFNSSLTPYLEKKLLDYLTSVRKSISKLEKDKLYYSFISTRYVVRGMGLYTAEQFTKSEFFIYSKAKNGNFYNVEILILGPYSTYYRTTVLESLITDSKKSVGNSKISNSWLKAKECYLDKLRDLNDSPTSTECNIEIVVEIEFDRVKVSYMSKNYGVHEINLSCNKEAIMGSPFYVNVLKGSNDFVEEKKTNENNIGHRVKNADSESIGTTDETEVSVKLAYNNNEGNNHNNINNKHSIIKTNKQDSIVNASLKSNKQIDKIQNDINERRNVDIKGSKHNISDFKEESTMEISKYLSELKNNCKKKVNLHNQEERNNSLYFSKENYAGFQDTVNCSFRRSCRITRKLPGLVQKSNPVVYRASPICSNHSVPEDLRKLTAEDKRKKFSIRKSLAVNCADKRASSSFSVEENRLEAPRNNDKQRNPKEGQTIEEKTSSSARINNNIFNKFSNIDNINRNDEDARIYRIVKEKKLFWETVVQNSNHTHVVKHIKNETNCTNNNSVMTKETKSVENQDIGIESSKWKKLPGTYGLHHVDPFKLLKSRSFSKSSNDLRYVERKRTLVTYKSMDANLDQCCNITLDNRARIYLDHISSFKSKSTETVLHSIKFKINKPN